jgi:hypothetical protein
MERGGAKPTPLDIERIIGEVAKRHNVLLRHDDPILVSITLHDYLLARALARIEGAVAASQNQIAASTAQAHAQQLAASKRLGKQLVQAAAEHIAGEVRSAAGEAVDAIKAAVVAELTLARQATEGMRQIRTTVWWAAAIAFATTAVAVTLAVMSPLVSAP